jgi:hypothetical protein
MVLWPSSRWHAPFIRAIPRFPGYISEATMLVVSESGASRNKQDKTRKNFIVDLWYRGEGDHFDYTHAKMPLGRDAPSAEREINELFELPQCVQP